METTFKAIQENLFFGSHAAIEDWDRFPWHRDRFGAVQTHKMESSQALAIDVFGTIKVSPESNRILSALAGICGVPDNGPWKLELEWTDPENLLHERRPTQVDAIAFGGDVLLVIECKFTEVGGGCSQPIPVVKGHHAGQRQCNGDYAVQTNPVNGAEGRCSLTGKGIRYWDIIPEIFGLNAERDYCPCPFKGGAYQWMRSVILADRLAAARDISAAVIAAYADADSLPTAKEARSGRLGFAPVSGDQLVIPISYRSIIAIARSVSDNPTEWDELARWVERKIKAVTDRKD